MSIFRRGINLALGGGGARGFAHVGVLEVLSENKIPVRALAGTSAGAIAGSGWALGRTAREMHSRVLAFSKSRLAKDSRVRAMVDQEGGDNCYGLSNRLGQLLCKGRMMGSLMLSDAVLDREYFQDVVNFFVPNISFEELGRPFAVIAADVLSGEMVVLNSGPLRPAILASSAVPGAAPVVELDGRFLMDGGVLCLVPALTAKALHPSPVLGVNVGPDLKSDVVPDQALEIYFRASEIQGVMLAKLQMQRADLMIHPKVGHIHWADFLDARELLDAGREAAQKALPEIRQLARPRLWPVRKSA